MKALIMANGTYGDLEWYRSRAGGFDLVICADGGAGRALSLDITPDRVVGDMDSMDAKTRRRLAEMGVGIDVYPPAKDLTDTMIAMNMVEDRGASDITVWGGIGSRLDHTLSNLFSSAHLTRQGKKVRFEQPGMTVHIVADRLAVAGQKGDTVSIIVLSEKAVITLHDFTYPLNETNMNNHWQWAVSNLIAGEHPAVEVKNGVVAVIHFTAPPEAHNPFSREP